MDLFNKFSKLEKILCIENFIGKLRPVPDELMKLHDISKKGI